MRPSLPWQQEALDRYVKSVANKDFVIVAGTGCGKTHTGAICASYEHIKSKEPTLILVVVPYRAIKSGWKQSFLEQGFEVATKKQRLATDTDVMITTYAGAGSVLDYFVKHIDKKLIIVFDEFHHMEENNEWAKPFVIDMDEDDYVKRIFLSGTPWHESGEISDTMVTYNDDGAVVHDVLYTYGKNVNSTLGEGRNTVAVKFHRVHAVATNHGYNKKEKKNEDRIYDTEKMTRSSPMTPLVNFSTVTELVKLDGVTDCLSNGIDQLKESRKIVPVAGGIIFVKDRKAGLAVQSVMLSDYGETALLVSSDDPKAHELINGFRSSKELKWIISIDMVSEGVDIPRLKVAIDLTNKMTMMHIMQRWGRILRMMRHKDHTPAKNTEAHVFFIAHPQLLHVSKEIEEDMRKFKRKGVEGGDGPEESDFVPGNITETAKPMDDMFKGRTIDQQISSLADWIISTGYMDLVVDGYGLSEAILLARHMIASESMPDCYEEPSIPSLVVEARKPPESKSDVVEDYTKMQARIAYDNFHGDHGACAKNVSSLWKRFKGDDSWSCDNKSMDELNERRDFMRRIERGQY